ncbi:MAG: histidine kinase [Tannerellaceae bacterium]|nr:histidine kinase [Tannerellaceae bacterium]
MRSHEQTSLDSHFGGFYLCFSLAWFFLFAFFLFVITVQGYKLGDKLFCKNEFNSTLFVIAANMIVAFALIQVYPLALHTLSEYILQIEKPDFPFEKPGLSRIRPDEAPDAPMHFFWPIDLRPFPRPLVTEHLFVLITVILTVMLLRLISSRQQIALEFEKLKTEKWQTSYNALMGQINPHFFFNSLNGLNSLIRSGEQEQTLTYLDELSSVFRYILQSNKKELVTLAEELQFVKAYTYLLHVRYEGRLFFSIQANSSHMLWYLPILSVLPLIENAVKHNVISKQYPLQVDIYTTEDNRLVVSNAIQPKAEDNSGGYIGLKNLWGRYRMLTGKDISISNRKGYFNVSLPLLNKPVKR